MASTTVQSAAYRWRPGCCAEGPAGDGGLRRGMRRPRRSSEARTPYGRTYLARYGRALVGPTARARTSSYRTAFRYR
jgi:hypothetical protein